MISLDLHLVRVQRQDSGEKMKFPQIPSPIQLIQVYDLQIDDVAVLLLLIRQTVFSSDYPRHIKDVTFSIHGNGFIPFFNFIHQFCQVILPGRVNTI